MNREDIIEAAEVKINQLGGYLVDTKINTTTSSITIYFDRIEGVSIDDCLVVSRYLENRFNEDIDSYDLTVCSAGLDLPFVVNEQYQKNIGKEVGVLLTNGKREKGVIISYGENLILETKKKKKGNKKEYIIKKVLIPKENIKETKLKINFK